MSTSAIISTRNFDINRISFVVGQAKNGRNPSISIKYDGQNLSLRLPRLGFPGGVLVREDDKTGTTSYTLIGSLRGCDPYGKERANDADEIGKFYNMMLDLEERIIQAAVENSVKWFGKRRSEEGIREGFKHLMRLSVDKVDGEYVPNGKYPPSVTMKIPVYDGRVNMEIIDPRGNPIYTSPATLQGTFSKGMEANLVTTASIYVMAGGGFGVTWRVTHAQVFPQSRVTAASIFSDTITNEQAPVQEEEVHEHVAETSTALNVEIPDNVEETAAPPAPTAAAARRRRAVPATQA